tara:strand:+ start:322 stop:642 length:321 start_codon:yes stop_codon:yes gene_type:complete
MKTESPDPSREDQTDVSVCDAVDLDGLPDGVCDHLVSEGKIESDAFGRLPHAFKMGLKLEDSAVVDPDSLETTIAIQKAVIENTDLGLLLGKQFAINPDLHDAVSP